MTLTQNAQTVVVGPAPFPPKYTLGTVADVSPQDGERWDVGGVLIDAFPAGADGKSGRWDEWGNVGDIAPDDGTGTVTTIGAAKVDGGYPTTPGFEPFVVYTAIKCSTLQAHEEARFQNMARLLLEATWWEAVEREFYGGALLPDNPHLTQDLGAGDFYPHSDTKVSPSQGLATLENVIGAGFGRGNAVIHCTPGLVSFLGTTHIFDQGGKLMTPNRTPVAACQGYVNAGGAEKSGMDAPVAWTQEWAWVTSMPQVRFGPILDAQPLVELVDRSTNVAVFRAERLVLVTYEAQFKAGVLIDYSKSP